MGSDNTYNETNFNPIENQDSPVTIVDESVKPGSKLQELLTDVEHIQEKIEAMGNAISGYKGALQEIKDSLMMAIMNATMNGALILKEGKYPYLIAGYIVLIDFQVQAFNNKMIRDIEVTDLPIIDVSLFK